MSEVTYRVDDLDGKTKVTGDATTVSLNGRTVTIDLSNKHVEELTALLAPYFENGVEVTSRKRNGNGTANEPTDKDRNATIRAWRQSQDRDDLPKVSDRGRLPDAVVKAFTTEVEGHASVASLEAAVNAGEKANA